ncbi:DUF6531 domain-containing protein [Microbulbifer sediminum]|uniref:DUF6531 domain-containing protein n=1 Tax=Microbulbifer sediminum TaxID=2904250 RepID=UPI001F3C27FD|nr:DUF6531 domain-containing protein [Microbulbifer sediminum]
MSVTLVGGNELGLLDSSYALLNDNKRTANNQVGGDEKLYVNVSNGNLVIQHQDAYLPSMGDDFNLVRTYNARGAASDAHGHEDARWYFSTGIRLDVRQGGQYLEVRYGDGSLYDYYWDEARQLYVSVDGAGAYETIRDLGAIGDTDPAFELTRADQTRLTFSKQGELLAWEDTNGVRMEYTYESDRLVQVRDDTGHEVNYTYLNGQLYQVTDETGGVLVEYRYESGRLVEVVDRMGHSTKYHYTTDGFIERIELPSEQDADGDGVAETYAQRDINITYEQVSWRGENKAAAQVVTSITDAEGGVTTFDYDFAFHTNGEGQGSTKGDKISKGKGHRVDNTTDETSVTFSSKFFDGGSTTVVDALGNARAYSNEQQYVDWRVANGYYATYDAAVAGTDTSYQAQVDNIRQGHSLQYTYLSNGYITEIVDQEGYHSTYAYNDNGDLVSMTDRNAWGAVNSDSAYFRQLRADLGYTDAAGNGKLAANLSQAEQDALTELYTSHFNYDSNGNLLTLADNDGSETRFTYTSFNKIASRTSATGVALTVSDDAHYQALRQDLGYAALVADLSAADVQALLDLYTTFYEYDANQNLVEERSPGGDLTRYEYDAYGNRTRRIVFLDATDLTDPAKQQVTQYFYDAYGNNIETIDAEGNRTFAEYDHYGNLTRLIDGNGGVTTYTYDNDNRLLTVIDPEGHTTVNTYDAVGNRISVTDANGNTVYRFFDKNNRLIQTMDPSSVDPAQDRVTQYQYDLVGNRTSMTDAEGRTTEYVFNNRRELLEAITAAVAGADGNSTRYTTSYAYDGEGNRVTMTNHRGATTEMLYNADGIISQRTDANGHITRYSYDANNNQVMVVAGLQLPVSQRQVLKFGYDEEDQLEEQTDAEGGTTTFYRDAVGNVIAEVDARGPESGDAEAYTTRYEFDRNNRMIRETTPEVYDPETGGLSRHVIEHHYDANGNEVKMVDGNGNATTFAYDLDSQLVMVTDANGINTVYSYDANHNRTRVEVGVAVDANGAVIDRDDAQVTTYTYDEFNQLVAQTDGLGNALAGSNDDRYQQKRAELGYATDATLLTDSDKAALRALYTEHYTYDRVGNQLTRTDNEDRVTTFDYDALNRLVTTTDAHGSTITSKYDGNGNLVERKDQNGNITTYAYDALDRLTDTTNAIGTVTHNDYDDFGNVTSTTEAFGTAEARETQFVYNLNNWLVQQTDPEQHTVAYRYDAVGNRVEVTDGRGNPTQTVYDALDRVIKVIDAEGFETRYEYDGANNRVGIIDARGGVTRIDYDGGNRQVAMTDAEGRVTQYDYDVRGNRIAMRTAAGTADEQLTVFEYDAENNLRSVTDGEGNVTTNNYDRVYNRISVVDGNGNETTSAFDALNRLVSVTNAENETTTYSYDAVGNRLTTTDALGRVTSWTYDAVNRVTTQTDAHGVQTTYAYDAVDNRTSITAAANTAQAATIVFEYDLDDRLVREVDAMGGERRYSYDPNDNRTTVIDENGNATVYTYDKNNRVTDIQDPEGGITHYSYDGNGNRTQVIDPRGNATTSYFNANNEVVLEVDAEGYATSRVYDNNGNVASQTLHMTPVGAVTPGTEPTVVAAADDQTVTFDYDRVNRLTTRVDGEGNTTTYSYDGVGNQLTVTDGNGNTTVNTYDMVNRLVTVTNAEDETTVYTYDDVGNRVSMVDGNGHITSYTYDGLNRVVTETNAENETTTYAYDAVGNRIGMTDALGRETVYVYDLNNRMVKQVNADLVETTYAYDEAGNRTSMTAAANTAQAATTLYAYDGNNRVTDMTDAEGVVTHYVLDANGNAVEEHRAYGTAEARVSFTTFDKNNRATHVQDPEGGVTEYRYDAADNRVLVIDARGNVTTNYFDRANRGVATVDAEGYLTERSFDGVGNVTSQTLYAQPVPSVDPSVVPTPVADPAQDQTVTFEYDMVDRLTARTDGEGNRTSYTYDEVGNQLTVTDGNGNTTVNTYDMVDRLLTVTNAEGETTAYTYDDVGNRLTVTDGNGHTSSYQYDLLNQLVAETNAENETTRYDYDAVGNRISSTDALGRETRWEYDLNNRVTKEINADLVETTYAYDELGNRTSMTVAANTALAQTTAYSYDLNNRLVSSTDALQQTTSYGYDANGNRVSVTDPRGNTVVSYFDKTNQQTAQVDAEGYVTTWTYDAAGNRVGQTLFMAPVTGADPAVPPSPVAGADDQAVVYEFDRANRLAAQVNGEGDRTEYTYDGVGNQLTVTDGNGNTTVNTYDAANRLLTSTNAEGETTSYTYDEVGNRLAMTDGNGHTTSYGYDQVNRLVTVTNAENETTRYGYDAVGNRISETDALLRETTWEYDVLNRVVKETAADLVETTYAYDEVGNRTSMTVAANTADAVTTSYTYDDNNQLRSETNALNQTVSYDYDANGNRVAMTDARGNTTSYTFDKNNRLTHVTDPELHTVEYRYDAADNQVEMVDARGNVTTNYFDRANRQVASVDAEGFMVQRSYDNAGNLQTETRYMTALGSVDPLALPTPVAGPDDQVVTFEYDRADRLTARISGEGFRTEFTYDEVGNRTSVRQHRDLAGTDIAETRFFFDSVNRQVAQLSAEGYLTETVYDDVGNVKSVTLYDERASVIDGVPQAQAGDTGRTTSYDYDAINQVVSETSALDVVTAYTYDERGNRTAVIEAQGTADERSTLYTYDQANRVTDITDAEGVVTHYELDANGNIAEAHEAFGTADVRVTYNSYDKNNRITQTVDPLGVASTFAYDGNGNLSSQTLAVGLAEARTESFEYDRNNRQTAQVNGEGERTEFTYDGAGNRTGVIVAPGLPEQQSTSYEYDLDNRQVALVDGEGMRVEYVLDGAGNKRETIQAVGVAGLERHTYYDYDLDNRITQVQDPMGGVTQYEYDVLGNQTRIIDANGGEQLNTFDQLGRMLTSLSPAGTLTVNTYDQRGNILTATQSFADGSDARTTTYAYDLLDRQVAITDGEGFTTSIDYDAFGNQTLVTVGQYLVDPAAAEYDADKAARAHVQTNGFTYDAADRMLTMTDGEGNVTAYAYDAVGNRTSMTEAANSLDGTAPRTTEYFYDKANRQVRVENPAGGVTENVYDEAGNRQLERVLQSSIGGVEVWTETEYEYDGNGRMTAMIDDYDTRTEYQLDAMGNQVEIRYAAGTAEQRSVWMEYDLNNRKTADIDGEQNRTEYRYDALGNRTQTIDALGRVARYYFDGANRLSAILDPEGTLNTFAYDSVGNQVEARLYANRYTGPVDDFTAPVGTASSDDRVTLTDYDRNSRALTVTEADGSVTQNRYDAAGNLLQEVLYANTSDPRTRSYTYDLNNRIETFTDVDDTVTHFSWDAANNKTGERIVSATDPNAVRETVYVYDLNNRQVQQVFDPQGLNLVQSTAYDKAGNIVTQTDANGNSLHYAYDLANRILSEANDLGEVTEYTYDRVGNIKTMEDPRNVVTEYEYDDNNRVIRELGATVQVYTIGEGLSTQRLETTRSYDAFGNEVQTVDAAGYTTTRYFDANGRQVAELSADNVLTEWSYNAFGEKASETLYMTRLNATAHTDPSERPTGLGDARTTDMFYDRMGRLTRTVYPQVTVTSVDTSTGEPVATTGEVRPEETTVYDDFGNAIEVTDKNGNTTYAWYDDKDRLLAQVDPEGYLVEWDYDAQDNVLEQRVYTQPLDTTGITSATRPAAPAGEVYTVNKTYDAANRVIEERSPLVDVLDNDGVQTRERVLTLYTYDGKGNQTSRTVAAGTSQEAAEYSYYDAADRKVAVINSDRVLHTYSYDENGNLTQRKRYYNAVDAGVNLAALSGDTAFETLVAAHTNDQATTMGYDAGNRQTSETDLMDAANDADDITKTIRYNARGEQTWAQDGDGFVTEMAYDAAGRINKNISPDGTGSSIQYDAAGNQTLVYTGEIDSVAQAVSNDAINAEFGDMLVISWDMPQGVDQKSWVVWGSSSQAGLEGYDSRSAELGTWFSETGEVYIPSEEFGEGEALYFRVVTADRAGNLAWSEEKELRVPPTLGAIDVNRVDSDTTTITVEAGSNAQNVALKYGTAGVTSAATPVAMQPNGDGTWTVTLDGVTNLDEKSFRISWQDADGGSYQSSEKTFVASDPHVGVTTQLAESSVVSGENTNYLVNLDTRVPSELASLFSTVVATWTDANGETGSRAVEGVDNGDGTWSYALDLGTSASPLAAGSYQVKLEGAYADTTVFGAQSLVLDQFSAEVGGTTPLSGTRQGLTWQAADVGSEDARAQLVLIDGQWVESSRTAEGQLIVSAELATGTHSYNAFYGEQVAEQHSLDITSIEVTEEVEDPENPGTTITNVLGYDLDFGLSLNAAELASVTGDLTLSWRTAGSGLDFTDSTVMAFDGSSHSATLSQLQEGAYDVKLSYTDADGNEVIVQWLRLDSAQVTSGSSKNYQSNSLTVLGSETGGSINVAADGQIGFDTGIYSGPSADERNFVDLTLASTGNQGGSRTVSGVDAGYYTQNRYNALNQLVATNEGNGIWRHFGVDANGNQVATYTTGENGDDLAAATEIRDSYAVFDGRNRMLGEYGVATAAYGESGTVRAETTYAYDVQDNQVAVTDARGYTTSRAFNALGMMVWENDNRSGITYHHYDRLGNETRLVDQLGNETSKRYDNAGRVIEEINGAGDVKRYTYDVFGRQLSMSLVDGFETRTTSYSYDQRDRLIRQTDAGGRTLQFQYDNRDNRTGSRDIAGDWTYQEFDGLNRVTETRYEGVKGWVTETRQYDAYGNVIAEKDAAGRVTSHEYGAFSRKIATVDQGGRKTVFEYDEFGNQVREYRPVTNSAINTGLWNYGFELSREDFRYEFGQLYRSWDLFSSGTTTTGPDIQREYDEAGRLLSVVDNKTGVATSYQYDVAGNRMYEHITGAGGHNRELTYDYDAAGQIARWHDSVTGQHLNYLWDAAGNQKRVYTDAGYTGEGVNHWYDYDGANRVTEMRNGAAGEIVSAFTYDGLGQRETWNNKGTMVSYQYNDSGWVTRATWVVDDGDDAGSWYSTWGYDADGNVTRYQTFKNGDRETYSFTTYSANGISTYSDSDDQKTYSTYDASGRLLKTKTVTEDTTNTYTYYYHADGREQRIVGAGDANGTSRFTYDANDKLTRLDKGEGDGQDRKEYLTFVYNNDGQILYRYHDEGVEDDISRTEFQYANGNAVGEKKTWKNGDVEEQLDSGDYNLIKDIGEDYPSGAVTSVAAVDGDNLQSIAARVYGNPSLWFVLAEANGLDPSQPIKGGVRITVPNSVETGRIDADTHKVYNENDIIGSTLPNLKTPDSGDDCGNILMIIIVVVIAVVATIVTAGAAGALLAAGGGFLGLTGTAATVAAWAVAGAVVGAAASIVQQGLFIALGYQESFSWKEVAAGAVAGAFSGAAQGIGAAVKVADVSARTVKYAKTAAAALKVAGAASKQLITSGKITSWSSLAAAALGPTSNETAGINMEGFLDPTTLNMVTPWLGVAETYIREGELTTGDWVSAVGNTVGAAVGSNEDFQVDGSSLPANLLIGGAMSLFDEQAGKSYIHNAIGNEIGSAIGKDITENSKLAKWAGAQQAGAQEQLAAYYRSSEADDDLWFKAADFIDSVGQDIAGAGRAIGNFFAGGRRDSQQFALDGMDFSLDDQLLFASAGLGQGMSDVVTWDQVMAYQAAGGELSAEQRMSLGLSVAGDDTLMQDPGGSALTSSQLEEFTVLVSTGDTAAIEAWKADNLTDSDVFSYVAGDSGIESLTLNGYTLDAVEGDGAPIWVPREFGQGVEIVGSTEAPLPEGVVTSSEILADGSELIDQPPTLDQANGTTEVASQSTEADAQQVTDLESVNRIHELAAEVDSLSEEQARELQTLLNEFNDLESGVDDAALVIDGNIGPATEAAITQALFSERAQAAFDYQRENSDLDYYNKIFELGTIRANERSDFDTQLLQSMLVSELPESDLSGYIERGVGIGSFGNATAGAFVESLKNHPELSAIYSGDFDADAGATYRRTVTVDRGEESIDFIMRESMANNYREAVSEELGRSLTAEEAQQATIDAIRSVEPQVYLAVINSAFEADNIDSIGFSSGQRSTALHGANASDHLTGRALDISRINGVAVNNGGYDNLGQPLNNEPAVQASFTDNLFESDVFDQVFTPYEVRYGIDGNIDTNRIRSGAYNLDISSARSDNNYVHRHHIHVGGYRAGSR